MSNEVQAPLTYGICVCCGKEFSYHRSRKARKYCSAKCCQLCAKDRLKNRLGEDEVAQRRFSLPDGARDGKWVKTKCWQCGCDFYYLGSMSHPPMFCKPLCHSIWRKQGKEIRHYKNPLCVKIDAIEFRVAMLRARKTYADLGVVVGVTKQRMHQIVAYGRMRPIMLTRMIEALGTDCFVVKESTNE